MPKGGKVEKNISTYKTIFCLEKFLKIKKTEPLQG